MDRTSLRFSGFSATEREEPETRRTRAAHDTFGGSMLGRGVKRKWSCLEALEAESLQAAAEKTGGGDGDPGGDGGFPAGPSRADAIRSQQRQRVLGLCLEKLQHYQAGVELSLRRSVLLVNTLRQLQEDMQSDGAAACDLRVTCPGCAELDGERPPSQDWNGPPEQQKSPPAAAANALGDAASAMGYLGDLALDDIFEDIDTSMYDTSDLPSVWAAGPLWPVGVSLWADEDVKVRAAGHAAAGSLQSCLMDLNELDHIMEILVKA